MSVTRVDVRPYALPLRVPYRWAKGEQTRRCGLLVRMDRDGATGYGECAPPPHEAVDGPAFAAACLSLLEGLDLEASDFLEALDARDPAPRLRCGLSTAWLSLRAASADRTLSEELAPDRKAAVSVPVNELVTDAAPDACGGGARPKHDQAEVYQRHRSGCKARGRHSQRVPGPSPAARSERGLESGERAGAPAGNGAIRDRLHRTAGAPRRLA